MKLNNFDLMQNNVILATYYPGKELDMCKLYNTETWNLKPETNVQG